MRPVGTHHPHCSLTVSVKALKENLIHMLYAMLYFNYDIQFYVLIMHSFVLLKVFINAMFLYIEIYMVMLYQGTYEIPLHSYEKVWLL